MGLCARVGGGRLRAAYHGILLWDLMLQDQESSDALADLLQSCLRFADDLGISPGRQRLWVAARWRLCREAAWVLPFWHGCQWSWPGKQEPDRVMWRGGELAREAPLVQEKPLGWGCRGSCCWSGCHGDPFTAGWG